MTGQRIQTGYSDEPLEVLNNDFVRDGYDFICWNTKPDGSGVNIYPNQSIDVQRDTVLYAQWKLVYVYMQLIELGAVNVKSNTASFSVNAGLRTPSYFSLLDSNSFELMLKLTTSSDVNTAQTVFRQSASYDYGLYLENGKLIYKKTGATSSVNIQANTTYYLKAVKNYNTVDIYLSTDGITFSNVLSTSTSFNVINQYFVFGQRISWNEVKYETDYRTVTKYRNPAHYTYEPRWITNDQWCSYGDKNGKKFSYANKLRHSAQYNSIKNSAMPDGVDVSKINWSKSTTRNCGYWQKDYPVFHPDSDPYPVQESYTKQTIVPYNYEGFKGVMDFNESYFMLNNLKHKLKA